MMRVFAVMTLALLGTACAKAPAATEFRETPECANYRGMMTAPIPPSVHERLRLACEQSN